MVARKKTSSGNRAAKGRAVGGGGASDSTNSPRVATRVGDRSRGSAAALGGTRAASRAREPLSTRAKAPLAGRKGAPLSAAITRGYERYLKIALALPGTEASTSYRTPSVMLVGKIFSRWRAEAEGGLAIRCDFLDRQILLQTQPEFFFLTDHYLNYPMILVHLDKISRDALVDVVERAWRLVAPAKLVKAREASSAAS
jgi:hypothetical protein